MSDFIRARSNEKKELRMNDIKHAVDDLFKIHTYHEITLTTIAEKLNWSRANLYKYVTSKEEIFLELLLEKQYAYTNSLRAAFPSESNYSKEVFAEVWAGIINSNKDYFRYSSILTTIIETNVTLERLTEFKKNVFSDLSSITNIFSNYLKIQEDTTTILTSSVNFHAIGLCNTCTSYPLIKEACKLAGIPEIQIDFKTQMQRFILMCIDNYCYQYENKNNKNIPLE